MDKATPIEKLLDPVNSETTLNEGKSELVTPCRFCGQVFITNKGTQIQREEEAIRRCGCAEANIYRTRLNYIANAKVDLAEVFDYKFVFAEHEVDPETLDEIRKILERFFVHMVNNDVGNVQLTIPLFGKITLSSNSNGKIKIKRVLSTGIEKEVCR